MLFLDNPLLADIFLYRTSLPEHGRKEENATQKAIWKGFNLKYIWYVFWLNVLATITI